MRIVLNNWIRPLLTVGVFGLLAACSTVPNTGQRPAQGSEQAEQEQVQAGPTPARRELRLGLALGGGAARGFAHIGVIQVLEEAGLRPQLVVGTSAGSLVAALYASGKSPTELRRAADTMNEAEISDWVIPLINRGAIKGEALARYVNQQVGQRPIDKLPMPLGIVATDLHSGQGMLFQRGDMATAVRAASAVPSLFEPVRIGGRDYVDGGLVSPVPVRYARQMGADLVLAVDISSPPAADPAADLHHHGEKHQWL